MKPVKIGVIGCGVIGPQHIQAAIDLPVTEMAAVADKVIERAKETAEKYGIAKAYGSTEELLNDPEIEGVVLALPTGFRVGLAQQALAHGKHVMIEKPAAIDLAEFNEIAAAAAKSPELVVAFASARYLFLPHTKAVAEFIVTGALGDLRSIHFRATLPPGPVPTSPPPAWRVSHKLNGGGILVNWGIYELDYMFGITGWKLKPRHVLANSWGVSPQFSEYVDPASDADEHFSSFIVCDDGTTISYERGERVASRSETVARIVGTNGSLSLAMFPDNGKQIIFHNSAAGKGVWDEVIWEGDEEWTRTRTGIIEDFALAIRGEKKPQTGIPEALVMQKVTDAIYRSAHTKGPVRIED